MTAWASERQAIENMIDTFGTGFFACVMDSYDYAEVTNREPFVTLTLTLTIMPFPGAGTSGVASLVIKRFATSVDNVCRPRPGIESKRARCVAYVSTHTIGSRNMGGIKRLT